MKRKLFFQTQSKSIKRHYRHSLYFLAETEESVFLYKIAKFEVSLLTVKENNIFAVREGRTLVKHLKETEWKEIVSTQNQITDMQIRGSTLFVVDEKGEIMRISLNSTEITQSSTGKQGLNFFSGQKIVCFQEENYVICDLDGKNPRTQYHFFGKELKLTENNKDFAVLCYEDCSVRWNHHKGDLEEI